jgi:succinate dehydrogenase/fumarate reductase flavoprotein subunit
MPPLLRNARVIDDPGRNPPPLPDGGQNPAAHFGQRRLVAPRGLGHQMMHRLPGRLSAVRMRPRRHGPDALALAGQQQQAFAGVFQRLMPVMTQS